MLFTIIVGSRLGVHYNVDHYHLRENSVYSRCDTGFYDTASDRVETSTITIIVSFVDRKIKVVCPIDLRINESGARGDSLSP